MDYNHCDDSTYLLIFSRKKYPLKTKNSQPGNSWYKIFFWIKEYIFLNKTLMSGIYGIDPFFTYTFDDLATNYIFMLLAVNGSL